MGTLSKYNWLFPLLILFSLALGTLGFYQYDLLHNKPAEILSCLYLSLQLFVLNSGGVDDPFPLTLQIARFLAPAVTASGIFLAIWEPFHHNFLLFKIRFWKEHVVVCGLSKKAELLILDFLKNKDEHFHIVLIEPNMEHGSLSNMRKKGVIVLHGNATDEEILQKANILNAKYLLALTSEEQTNILIAQKASHIYNQNPGKILSENILQVILHIDDFYTMNIFKEFHEKAVPDTDINPQTGTRMDYHAFSIYQLAAAYLIDNFSPDKYVSLCNDNDPPAHVLVMGDGLAAQYLILEAAQMYHFANLKKTLITVIADDVARITEQIQSLYPFLEKTVDLRYIPTGEFFNIPCPVPLEEISTCFVALDDDAKSVYYSRKLRQYFFAHSGDSREKAIRSFTKYGHLGQSATPIKVLLPRNTALVNIFDDVAIEMQSVGIDLLNMDDEICNKRTIVDNRKAEDFIAKHIHYEWAKNQAEKNKTPLGTMQKEWDKIKDSQKDSNRFPARHLYIKLRFVNAELSDQEAGEELNFDSLEEQVWDKIARMEHNRWNAEKMINGFVLTQKVSDKALGTFLKGNLKSHWDLVPYDQLDKETQEYDKFTFKMAPVIAHLNKKRILKKQE